jgi:SAM-dependent methyltransferase
MPPFYSLKNDLEKNGCTYLTCEINQSIMPTYLCDFVDIKKHISNESIDVILAFEVLEHMSNLWEVPKVMYDILKPGGQIYMTTPFYVQWHDPKPDYWRLTPDGIELLFGPLFDLTVEKLLWENDGGERPLHYRISGVKCSA